MDEEKWLKKVNEIWAKIYFFLEKYLRKERV